MSPDDVLDMHRRLLAEDGSGTVLIRRYAGKGVARAVSAESSVLAKVTMYKPEQLVGGIIQGDRKAVVINDPDAAVPAGKVALATLLPLSKFTDALVIGGSEVSVEAVDDQTRRIAGVLVALEIQVRG